MILALLVSGFIACAGTYATLRWLSRFGFVDVPNERSSHGTPTATLGGAGLLLGFLSGCLVYAFEFGETAWGTYGVVALCGLLAVFAWDELRPMGRLSKLLLQGIVAILAVQLLGSLDHLTLPTLGPVPLGGFGPFLTWFIYVTGQNLYNFMDGIDGLAGLEGLLAGSVFAVVLAMVGSAYAPLPAFLAAASLGFLVWNRPVARIFMGDIGGHLLGLMLSVFIIVGEHRGVPAWLGSVVVGTFLFDATYTLVRRAIKGENVTKAHRFHLYQRLVRLGWSHLAVDLAFGGHTIVLGAGVILALAGYRPVGHSIIAIGLVSMTASTVLIERRWLREGETV